MDNLLECEEMMRLRVCIYVIFFIVQHFVLFLVRANSNYDKNFNGSLTENILSSFSIGVIRRIIGREHKNSSNIMNIRNRGNGNRGPCKCGIFHQPFVKLREPLFHKTYINVGCDHKGENVCHESCVDLNLIARKYIEKDACRIVKNASGLQLSLSTQICSKSDWLYTGLTTSRLCCMKGEIIDCNIEIF